jgi:hypothetical protein
MKRGGKRPGSGRKRKPRPVALCMRLSPELHAAWLARKGNISGPKLLKHLLELGAGEVLCGHIHQFGVLCGLAGAALEQEQVAGEADVVAGLAVALAGYGVAGLPAAAVVEMGVG